jgi:uncharacterized protein YfaS (alpha-2-macroglobulin family)
VSGGKNADANIKVRVKTGSQGVAGAALTLTVTTAKGVVKNLTGTAAADGTASVKMPLDQSDKGTYQVQVTASSNGATGTASTTFTVR